MSTAFSSVFHVGDRVEAKQRGDWLKGTISAQENGTYQVKFDEGNTGYGLVSRMIRRLPDSQQLPLSSSSSIPIAASTVTSSSASSSSNYNNYDNSNNSNIRSRSNTSSNTAAAAASYIPKDSPVYGLWNSQWYPATVVSCPSSSDPNYIVKWNDGGTNSSLPVSSVKTAEDKNKRSMEKKDNQIACGTCHTNLKEYKYKHDGNFYCCMCGADFLQSNEKPRSYCASCKTDFCFTCVKSFKDSQLNFQLGTAGPKPSAADLQAKEQEKKRVEAAKAEEERKRLEEVERKRVEAEKARKAEEERAENVRKEKLRAEAERKAAEKRAADKIAQEREDKERQAREEAARHHHQRMQEHEQELQTSSIGLYSYCFGESKVENSRLRNASLGIYSNGLGKTNLSKSMQSPSVGMYTRRSNNGSHYEAQSKK